MRAAKVYRWQGGAKAPLPMHSKRIRLKVASRDKKWRGGMGF